MKRRQRWISMARGGVTLATLGVAVSLAVAGPAEEAARRQEQAIDHVKAKAVEVTERALAGIDSLEDWKAVRGQRHREYLYMLGLDPLPQRESLRAEITGTLETESYVIEKLVFQSSPGLYVTGNFYLPREGDVPLPTILYVCGHSPHPLGAKYHYQDRAQWFAENGYACLIIDTLEFGEVAGIHHGLHNLNMWRWLSAGYTPAGVEVWNAMRAIDYLETRKEVDPKRIGITGISGGGAVSWFTAAADERIAVAVPVCGTYTFGSQATHWLADGQCDCIYFHNTFQSDLPVLGALIAPRPLMTCSGIRDGIFPPDGYHEVYRQTKRIYDFHGVDALRDIDDDVPHQDSPKLRQAARQWFNRWLKDDVSPVERVPNPTTKRHSAEELACLAAMPWNAGNFGVHDHFVARAELPGLLDASGWKRRRDTVLGELRDKTFRWFPQEVIPFHGKPNGGHGGWMDRYGDYGDVQIQTEPGISVRVQGVTSRERSVDTPLVIYVKRRSDRLSFVDVDELLPVLGRCDVAMVNPRLTEQDLTPQAYANIERTAVWSGRTMAAMQVWDILRVIRWFREQADGAPRRVILFAKGEMAVPALYAAALEEKVSQVIVRDPPGSHAEVGTPPLLNVLRFTDLAEVAAMSASRFTALGRLPDSWSLVERVRNLEISEVPLSARSLPEALFPPQRYEAEDHLGRWAFSLPDGNPAWLKLEREGDGDAGALLWSVGSARPVKELRVDDSGVEWKRSLRWKPHGEGPLRIIEKPIRGQLDPFDRDRLWLHVRQSVVEEGEEVPVEEASFSMVGKRLPPFPPKPDLERVSFGEPVDLLANGLEGWQLLRADRKRNGWRFEDGVLINETPKTDFGAYGSYGNLRTVEAFGDFELTIDYLVEAGGNSGIYLRGMYEAQVVDRDSRMQGIQGPGAIFGRLAPAKNAARPPGEWNRYRLTLVDQHITVELNGQVVIDNQLLEGCTGGGMQADDTKPGPLFLQGDHTSVRYRNIVLRPVTGRR